MKRLILILFLIQIAYIVTCHTLRYSDHVLRGIDISSEDPRLFNYADTVFINKFLIDSCLKRMCGDSIKSDSQDTIECMIAEVLINRMDISTPLYSLSKIPIVTPYIHHLKRIDAEIIELANIFVNEGEVNIIYDVYSDPVAPIKKSDLEKLYISFSGIQGIEAKDIIDIININKQKRHYTYIELKPFLSLSGFDTLDSLSCEYNKIIRKYKHGVTDRIICPNGYSLLEDSSLSVKEKIAELEHRVRRMSLYTQRYGGIYDAKILRLKQNIDSLNRLLPQNK